MSEHKSAFQLMQESAAVRGSTMLSTRQIVGRSAAIMIGILVLFSSIS